MPLVKNAEPVTIELSTPGEWVKVKPKLSAGDEQQIKIAASRDATIERDATGKTQIRMASEAYLHAEFAVIECAVVEWSFDDPITPETLRTLDPADADLISVRLNELYPVRTPAERSD